MTDIAKALEAAAEAYTDHISLEKSHEAAMREAILTFNREMPNFDHTHGVTVQSPYWTPSRIAATIEAER